MTKTQEILRQRAEQISQKSTLKVSSERMIEVLEFNISDETYCMETSHLLEVHKDFSIVRIPTAPSFVMGIFNRRGKITTVVDLRVLFKIPHTTRSDKGILIVIADEDKEFAIWADSIGAVRYITESSISSELPTLSTYPIDYVIGIDSNKKIILNAKKIINDPNLVVNEQVI
ncbi:MAG: chemotaxis protein CheW [Thermodesulfovibrionales bacterium]